MTPYSYPHHTICVADMICVADINGALPVPLIALETRSCRPAGAAFRAATGHSFATVTIVVASLVRHICNSQGGLVCPC